MIAERPAAVPSAGPAARGQEKRESLLLTVGRFGDRGSSGDGDLHEAQVAQPAGDRLPIEPVVTGEVTVGGTIEPIHNAVSLAEMAIEKGAKSLLLPVACRKQLFDLSDDMATKLDIEFYQDARDALMKALVD